MQVFYIAEINLPNKSAYAQHVFKMCDAFASNCNVNLVVLSKEKKFSFKKIKNEYLLKNNFVITPYKEKKVNVSFINRLKFSFFVKNKIISSKKNKIILSRSLFSSFLLTFCNYFNFLEIHNNFRSLSYFVFKILYYFFNSQKIYFILIHKNLKKVLGINKKYIILDDAVELQDYKKKYIPRVDFDFTYVGSLYPGKGVEIINYLSRKLPGSKFHIFGSLETLNDRSFGLNKIKNLIFHGHIPYKKVPKILAKSRILLMPYLNRVTVKSNNLNVSKFMSPLKLFDYLASGKAIIASNLPVYNHILKDGYNCLLADPNNFDDWINKIKLLNSNKILYKNISNNAYNTAKKYTWSNRSRKVIKLYNKCMAK
jgi:glycosyltransferase involved in cell wall biosynthesis